MGFIANLTNKITRGQDLKDRIKKIEDYKVFLQESDQVMMDNVAQLYELRKEALYWVQNLNIYIKKLPNHPVVLEEGCKRALTFMDSIEKADRFEKKNMKLGSDFQATRGGGVAAAGAVAGTLTATVGPTAAMALATTFGTASTGAAISTLGGAAATNAALAWLGGGALAVGGNGMAAGSALLASLGPIGISIGVISLGVGGLWIRHKNAKKIEKIDQMILDLDIYNNKKIIKKKKKKLITLKDKTQEVLQQVKEINLPKRKADYNTDSFPRQELFTLVDNAKLLGKMSRESILIGKQ